jgi:hypothetical protein
MNSDAEEVTVADDKGVRVYECDREGCHLVREYAEYVDSC